MSPQLTPLPDSSEDEEVAALKAAALQSKAEKTETQVATDTLKALLNTDEVGLNTTRFEQEGEGEFSPGPDGEAADEESPDPVEAVNVTTAVQTDKITPPKLASSGMQTWSCVLARHPQPAFG